jgi:protein gp37
MERCPQHTFQVLTKRSDRLLQVADELPWPANVWMAVSVESLEYLYRLTHLREVPAQVRFLSVEPLLGPIDSLPLEGVHWVIAGGESGYGARPMKLDWARMIRDACITAEVPFFLKQLGGAQRKRGGDDAVLDGRLWREMPQTAMTP